MAWTVNTDDDVINVRAVINTKTQPDELAALIASLRKHLEPEEKDSERNLA